MKETLTYCRYTDRQDAMCKLSGRGVLVMGGPSLISVDVCVCVTSAPCVVNDWSPTHGAAAHLTSYTTYHLPNKRD